jgi:predicted nuclease of predicted toxin-antitoxin system
VRLLLDHNLSRRLVARLADKFPGISHVSMAGLDRASDNEVWEYAAANDYAIVTKDADFSELSVLRGDPPKVIWLRLGNCTTDDVVSALVTARDVIGDFDTDPEAAVLELS